MTICSSRQQNFPVRDLEQHYNFGHQGLDAFLNFDIITNLQL